MAITVTIEELRRMGAEDLHREILEKQALIAKMRLHVRMGKEKDTALYRREKKQLARMLTVLREQRGSPLKRETKRATLSAPAKSRTGKRGRKTSFPSSLSSEALRRVAAKEVTSSS